MKPELPARWRRLLEERLALDLRSLGFFRIALALLVIVNLALLLPDLRAFYTDEGVLPRLLTLHRRGSRLSLHFLSGDIRFQLFLFSVSLAAAISLLVGWKTRISTFISWVLLLSLQERNPTILHGGDALLILLLFWGQFLPLGERFSMDTRKNKRADNPFSLAGAVFWTQIQLLYLVTAVCKLKNPVWRDGQAVYHILRVGHYTSAAGQWLLHYPTALVFLNYAVLAFEFAGPLLLILFKRDSRLRVIWVFLFIFMQTGFGIFMQLELFPWISSVAMIPFLPAAFWKKLRFTENPGPPAEAAPRKTHPLTHFALLICLTDILWYNAAVLGLTRMPYPVKRLAYELRLMQEWTMFAQKGLKEAIDLQMAGQTADGRQVMIWNQNSAKNETFPEFRNMRWQEYNMRILSGSPDDKKMERLGRFACVELNRSRTKNRQITTLEIHKKDRDKIEGENSLVKKIVC